MAEWDADSKLSDLSMEIALDNGDQVKTASRIFLENTAVAAQSIVHTALYSHNERLRLDAAKYVVERSMGKIGDTDPLSTKDPWEDLLTSITKESGSTE